MSKPEVIFKLEQGEEPWISEREIQRPFCPGKRVRILLVEISVDYGTAHGEAWELSDTQRNLKLFLGDNLHVSLFQSGIPTGSKSSGKRYPSAGIIGMYHHTQLYTVLSEKLALHIPLMPASRRQR